MPETFKKTYGLLGGRFNGFSRALQGSAEGVDYARTTAERGVDCESLLEVYSVAQGASVRYLAIRGIRTVPSKRTWLSKGVHE